MELMTSLRFFRMVETLSPAEVLHLALAARSGSTNAGLPPPSPARTRESVLPDGAGRVRHGGQGEPGTGFGDFSLHETPPLGS